MIVNLNILYIISFHFKLIDLNFGLNNNVFLLLILNINI